MEDTIRFAVDLDRRRKKKLDLYLVNNNLTGKRFLEITIDNLRPALDATAYTPRRKRHE